MKDKDASSHKKSSPSSGARSAKRTGAGDGPRRRKAAVPAGGPARIEARFRAVFECSRDAIGVSKVGVHIFVNPAYLDLFGFPPGTDLAGKPVLDLIAPERHEQIMSYILRRGRGESVPARYETRGLRVDGSAFDMEVDVSPYQENAEDHTLVILRDITEQKRTENDLRQSEERYRDLFENAHDGIFIQDDAGLRDCNHRGAAMYGLPKEQLIGRSPAEFAPERQPDGRLSSEAAEEKIQAALSGIPQTFEWQALRADGSPFDVEVTLSRIELGGSMCLQAIVRDITERKRSEDEGRRSERMLQTIIDAEPACVKLLDENANIIMMNRAGMEMAQADSPDQMVDQCICKCITPEYQPAFLDLTRRVFQGESGTVSFEIIGKKGRHLWLETHAVPLRNEKDKIVALLGVTRDVTEQKRAEQALRENQARLDLALQSAHMGVWSWDLGENRRTFDDLTCQLLGIDAQTFTGTAEEFLQALHPDDRDTVKAALSRAIEYDVPYEPTYRAIWRDGSVHYVAARGRLVRDDKGRPVRINGIVWDITDQHNLKEDQLKTQKLESIGTLAGGIAHDFNNLLQGIFGYISMARLTFDQKEKSLAMLAQAEKALHQSVNLTSQLLTFSKGGKPVKKVIDLRPVIENSAAFALSGSRVTYQIVVDKDLRTVEADEGQIGQVIQNIVLNADQSMPLGGMIRISARNMPAKAIVPHGDLQGDVVKISIHDQGAGIPAEHVARIFDPYFTTKEKGSGLGLATSYSIIKNHGGLLRVQSAAGKGTTFLIYLPASNAAVEEPKRFARAAASRHARVLVMDDEEVIRSVALELLSSIGHEVTCTETGETALKAYRAARDAGTPFDVIILDLTIKGGMGGIETLRKLAEIDPNVKAVVSSGYSDDAATSDYRAQGFQSFLRKPYTMEELENTLNALLA